MKKDVIQNPVVTTKISSEKTTFVEFNAGQVLHALRTVYPDAVPLDIRGTLVYKSDPWSEGFEIFGEARIAFKIVISKNEEITGEAFDRDAGTARKR